MGRYLKLAMTVANRQEPMQLAVVAVAAEGKGRPPLTRKADPCVRQPEIQGIEIQDLAACGSPACAGCYDVGDGKKIHPPKCGHGYSDWLKHWEPRGRTQ
jgi:hypothetical protein